MKLRKGRKALFMKNQKNVASAERAASSPARYSHASARLAAHKVLKCGSAATATSR